MFYALIFRFARNKIDVLLLCLKIFCQSDTKMNLGKKKLSGIAGKTFVGYGSIK